MAEYSFHCCTILCTWLYLHKNKYDFNQSNSNVETLNLIEEIGFIEDFDRVKEFLNDDYHSINKLNKIKEKPYFQSLTFAKCKKIIKDYNVETENDEENS